MNVNITQHALGLEDLVGYERSTWHPYDCEFMVDIAVDAESINLRYLVLAYILAHHM